MILIHIIYSHILISIWISISKAGHRHIHKKHRKIDNEITVYDDNICPEMHFKAIHQNHFICKPCSVCPHDQIIRKVCYGFNDTLCGPFYEFQSFDHGQIHISQHLYDNIESNSLDFRKVFNSTIPTMINDEQFLNTFSVNDELLKELSNRDIILQSFQRTLHTTQDASKDDKMVQWKELSFGLIGALIGMTTLALFYVLHVAIQSRKQKGSFNRCKYMEASTNISEPDNPPSSKFHSFKYSWCKPWLFCWIFPKNTHDFLENTSESTRFLPLHIISNSGDRAVNNVYVNETQNRISPERTQTESHNDISNAIEEV